MSYIKNTVLCLILVLATFSFANAKDDLTLLNTGGKTGGYSQQSLAYYTDLAKYKGDFSIVQLVNPGNKCVAVKSLLPKINLTLQGTQEKLDTMHLSMGHKLKLSWPLTAVLEQNTKQ